VRQYYKTIYTLIQKQHLQ